MEPEGAPEVAGFQQFEFALTDALIAQLVITLDELTAAPLDVAHVAAIPDGQGVYQLILDGKVEYVGKTDTDAGLSKRLAKHAAKISGRPSLRGVVSFKAVQVLVFSAMELETMLIRHYKAEGAPMSWQHSGFGSNDPGRRRDKTVYKDDHFDVEHPIDIDEPFALKFTEGMTLREALEAIKSPLPYTFRFERAAALDNATLTADFRAASVRDAIERLTPYLPTGWQVTRLPGYVIAYPENQEYASGEVVARS